MDKTGSTVRAYTKCCGTPIFLGTQPQVDFRPVNHCVVYNVIDDMTTGTTTADNDDNAKINANENSDENRNAVDDEDFDASDVAIIEMKQNGIVTDKQHSSIILQRAYTNYHKYMNVNVDHASNPKVVVNIHCYSIAQEALILFWFL